MHAARRVAVELGKHPESLVEQPQSERRPRNRRELVGDAEAGDDAVDFVVQMHSAGLRVHARPAVEDEAVHAVLRQQRGGGDARRSGADDRDRNVPSHAYRTVKR